MKLNINQGILKVDGESVLPNTETGGNLTLKDVCINSLLMPWYDDQGKLDPTEEKKKFDKYTLYKKFRETKAVGGESFITLTVEEANEVRRHIVKHQSTLVMGQALEMLESATEPKKK